MTLIFIVVVILGMWVMYDAGIVMREKIRIQNTADNVAYSTATLVARDLNFIAYTNRGMAANQAAIGQMVGLSSWAAMMEQFATNIDTAANFFPPAKPFTSTIKEGATASADAMDDFARQMIRLNEYTIDGLTAAQWAFHNATLVAVAEFSKDVAEMNDPLAESVMEEGDYSFPEAGYLVAEWNENIGPQFELEKLSDDSPEALKSHQRFQEFDEVVKGARDRFTRRRSYEWGPPFTNPYPRLHGGDWESRKYGGSDFFRGVDESEDTYKWDWAGMETAGLYLRNCYPRPDPPGVEIECTSWAGDFPWTWGAAHVLDESAGEATFFNYGDPRFPDYDDYADGRKRSHRSRWGKGAWRNPYSAAILLTSVEPNPYSGDHVQHKLMNIEGLRSFYAFREDGSDDYQMDTGPAIIALYVKNEADLVNQSKTIEGRGGTVHDDLDADRHGGLLNQRLGGVAKAEPYFARPTDLTGWARADRQFEHGSLYNPFWQARLVELTDAEKLAATAIITRGFEGGE